MDAAIRKATAFGFLGALALLAFYFAAVTLVSGWAFALSQFASFWYFIVGLAAGFGIQVGLYSYLRSAVGGGDSSGKALAVSGTTSSAAMISCCAHYLANILPVIGATGVISFIGQYQIELFWIGLTFNVGGIIYIARKVTVFRKLRQP